MWNIRASYFRQEAGESIIDYGLRFDTEIVETYPLSKPMNDLQKTRVYCVELRACYRLPRPAKPYPDFATLRARHEEIIDMDVVPHGPPIPAPPPAPVHAPAPAPVPAPKEGIGPEELIPEPQEAPEDQFDQVDQNEPLNGFEPQAPMYLVVDNQWNMDFEPGEPEVPDVQVILVFPWGPMIMPQPDPDWPIGDVDDQILDPEPKIIDLDSDDETIQGLKDMIIVSDDSD